jgi:POT family proton-dependent oligopeptide transporter
VGVAGRRHDQAELVSARADASIESCTRYAPDSVQQPGALSRSQTVGIRADTVTAYDSGHRLSGLAWIVVGAMQLVLDHGDVFTITWQVLPYVLLTFGEVLVATTGLEFAYSQAPLSMKGAIMAFWNLSVTIGNLWVLVANAGVQNSAVTKFIASTGFGVTAFQMFFFAVFAFAAALAFGLVARTYPLVDHYRRHDQ